MRAFLLLLCFALSLHALKVTDQDGKTVQVRESEDAPGYTVSVKTDDKYTLTLTDEDYSWYRMIGIKNDGDGLINVNFSLSQSEDNSPKYKLIYTLLDVEDYSLIYYVGTDILTNEYYNKMTFYNTCKNKPLERGQYSNEHIPVKHSTAPTQSIRIQSKGVKLIGFAFQDCTTGKLVRDDDKWYEAADYIKTNLKNIKSGMDNIYKMISSTPTPNVNTEFMFDTVLYGAVNQIAPARIIEKEETLELTNFACAVADDTIDGKKANKSTDTNDIEKITLHYYKDGEEKRKMLENYSEFECIDKRAKVCPGYREVKYGPREFESDGITPKVIEVYIEDEKQVMDVDGFKWTKGPITEKGNPSIKFTIPNKDNLIYRKMFIDITCKYKKFKVADISGKGKLVPNKQRYFFDARPAKLVMTPEIKREHDNPGGWNADDLYAEYAYPVKHKEHISSLAHLKKDKENKNNIVSENLRKTDAGVAITTHEDRKKYNDSIKIEAVDNKGNIVKGYTSVVEAWLVNTLYDDETAEPDCTGFSQKCTTNFINMVKGLNDGSIYTHIAGNRKYLQYNNVGPTQIFAKDQEWTYFTQNNNLAGESVPACIVNSTTNTKDTYGRIGCNVGLVTSRTAPPSNKGVDFYYFKPAVLKIKMDLANSPATKDSYGSKNYTFVNTINEKSYNKKTGDIFEAADINASILAIGASEDSFDKNNALSDYDATLKIAKEVEFESLGLNPRLRYLNGKEQKEGDVIDNFPLHILVDQDLKDAVMVDISDEKNIELINQTTQPDRYTEVSITDENGTKTSHALRVDQGWDGFKNGRNEGLYKLNFDRNDLLARDMITIGKSSIKFNTQIEGTSWVVPEWEKFEAQNISIAGQFTGEDLNFIDAAIIAPDFSSNGAKDVAVFLGVYCETNCERLGTRIPNHIRYYALPINVIDDSKAESSKTSLFSYSGATFRDYKKGADYLNGVGRSTVTLKLRGTSDETKNYCSLLRNCQPLSGSGYGLKFDVFFSGNATWTGSGDKGDTIIDDTNNKRRKAPRMSF